METIKSYKGFKKDMTCRGFQYEEGKEYETEKAQACEVGFHACEYPLDCFSYYNPSESVFHEVEQSGHISKDSNDSKIASSKIKIGAEIGIPGLVKAAIEYTMSNTKKGLGKHNTGDYGASSNTGYRGVSSNTGDRGVSSNTGDYGASSNTGNYGASSNTGNCGVSSNTGNRGASSNTGNCGVSSNTGDYGVGRNTGYRGVSSNTGDYGASSNTGNCGVSSNTGYSGVSEAGHPNSVSVAWGPESKAKGVKGSFLVLAEWKKLSENYWLEDSWEFVGSVMVRVDGERIKENVLYTLKNGEVAECVDED